MTETFASAFCLWGKLYFFLFCVYDHYRFKTDNTDLPVIFHLMPSGISICNEPIYNEVLGINEQYCPPQ